MGTYIYGITNRHITAGNVNIHKPKYIIKAFWGWETNVVASRAIRRYKSLPSRGDLVAYEFKEGEPVFKVQQCGNVYKDHNEEKVGHLTKVGRKWDIKYNS